MTDEEREERKALAAEKMYYRSRFPGIAVTVTGLLTYGVMVPLLLFIGLVWIIVTYLIDKNNLIHVFPKEHSGDSSMIISWINMLLLGFLYSEMILSIFFYFRGAGWPFYVIIGLMGLTLGVAALMNFLHWYSKYRYIKYGKPMLITWFLPQTLLEIAYQHPGLIKEEDDLCYQLDNFVCGEGANLGELLSTVVEDAEREYVAAIQTDDDFAQEVLTKETPALTEGFHSLRLDDQRI